MEPRTQRSGIDVDRECLARVAAHATGTSVEQFRAFAGCPPFSVVQFASYLERHGFAMMPESQDRTMDALALAATRTPRWVHALFWRGSDQTLLDCTPGRIIPVIESDFNIKCRLPFSKSV